MATPHPVPYYYRVVFTWIDPFFCTVGLITHLFGIGDTLRGYSPSAATDPPAIETVHLLDSMAGFFAALGTLEAVLLRVRGRDPTVWRIVQGCFLLLDILMVWGAVRALTAEGRMDVAVWRGDDWRLLAGNAVAAILRLLCALGIGFSSEGKSKGA